MRREALKAAYEQLADAEDLRKAGQLERAHRITSILVKQFPTYWAALHTHGLVLSEKGDLAEALRFLLLADSAWPNQPTTIAALAQTRADVAEPADHMNDEDRRVVEVDQCFH